MTREQLEQFFIARQSTYGWTGDIPNGETLDELASLFEYEWARGYAAGVRYERALTPNQKILRDIQEKQNIAPNKTTRKVVRS